MTGKSKKDRITHHSCRDVMTMQAPPTNIYKNHINTGSKLLRQKQSFCPIIHTRTQLLCILSQNHKLGMHRLSIVSTIGNTYLDWVCLVRFFMVKPSFPMIAPTNCVGTRIRSGKSSCLGCEEPPGEGPCSLEEWPPRRDR